MKIFVRNSSFLILTLALAGSGIAACSSSSTSATSTTGGGSSTTTTTGAGGGGSKIGSPLPGMKPASRFRRTASPSPSAIRFRLPVGTQSG